MTDSDRPIAVLDIDGVVADVRHRLRHLRGPDKDWDAFFAAMEEDPLLPEGLAVAGELARRHRIVYVTGRPGRYAEVTARWLRRHGLPPGPVLHRPNGDRRPARLVKPELVATLARDGRVAIVVDDDPSVLTAFRRAGVPVFAAEWADPQQGLFDAQEHGQT